MVEQTMSIHRFRPLLWSAVGYGFLLAGSFYFWGMVRLEGDGVLYYALIENFYSTRFERVTAEEYLDQVEPHRMMYKIIPWRWHPAIIYPPGMAVGSLPGIYLGDRLGSTMSLAGSIRYPHRIGRVFGILLWHLGLTWLALVLLHQVIVETLKTGHKIAFLAVTLVFLGTPWWFYATRQILYSHALEVAMIAIGLAGWWWGIHTNRLAGRFLGLLSGICWGLAVATRYSAVGWVIPFFLIGSFVALKRRVYTWPIYSIVGGLPFLFLLLWYHARFYTSLLETGYASILFVWSYPLKQALSMVLFRSWAVWLHPVRGMLVWHPIAIPALIGLFRLPKVHRIWGLATTLGLWLLLIVYTDWWAGVSCGQRLLLDVTPALLFGLSAFLIRYRKSGLWIAMTCLLWNVVLTLGFTAGAWRGYNDGRLGERYPFYHIFTRIASEPSGVFHALMMRTWRSPDHPRFWMGYKRTPARQEDYLSPLNRDSSVIVSGFIRTPEPARYHLIITIRNNPRLTHPDGWLMTAVTEPVEVIPGLHRWDVSIGYPSPFLVVSLDRVNLPLRFHTENLHQLLLSGSAGGPRIEISLLDEKNRQLTVYHYRVSLPTPLSQSLMCQRVGHSYFSTRPRTWTAPANGRVLVWAWPYLEPPWYQGIRHVREGETLPVPFRPLQIARQAYVGDIVICFEKYPDSPPEKPDG